MNEFLNLILETWELGISGVSISELLICLLIIIGGLIARTLLSTNLVNRLSLLTQNTETEIDDVLLESLRAPIGMIPIAFALYLITAFLPLSGSLDLSLVLSLI